MNMSFTRTFAFSAVAAAAVVAFGTGTAHASGPVHVDPPEIIYTPPAPVRDWAGAYGGLSFSSVSGETLENGATLFPLDSTSGLGIFGGYNWQSGNFVFGGELSYIDFEADYTGVPGATQSNSLEVRARAGYAMNNVLLYGFVGAGRSTTENAVATADLSGAVYGLGAQVMFGSNMFGGLELARRDYSGPFNGANEESTIDTISLRIGFQF